MLQMIPELYINKVHQEAEEEGSDTVFSALETPRNLDYNFDTIYNVSSKQEENEIRMRALPEFSKAQCLLYPDDPVKQYWDALIMMYRYAASWSTRLL
jgi:hypothetical protein